METLTLAVSVQLPNWPTIVKVESSVSVTFICPKELPFGIQLYEVALPDAVIKVLFPEHICEGLALKLVPGKLFTVTRAESV